jgi:hypothetical protein
MRRVALATLVTLVGCTDPAGQTVTCAVHDDLQPVISPGPLATRYLPLAVGAVWRYRFTGPLETTEQVVTVEGTEPVVDTAITAYRVVTRKAYGAQLIAWLEDRGDQIVRHRELAIDGDGDTYGDERFTPGRPLLDENPGHLDAGSTWKTHFTDTITDSGGTYQDCKTDHFEVASSDMVVTVPAGTFHTMELVRTDNGDTIWYARGIGRVKQVGATTRFELLSYQLPAGP